MRNNKREIQGAVWRYYPWDDYSMSSATDSFVTRLNNYISSKISEARQNLDCAETDMDPEGCSYWDGKVEAYQQMKEWLAEQAQHSEKPKC